MIEWQIKMTHIRLDGMEEKYENEDITHDSIIDHKTVCLQKGGLCLLVSWYRARDVLIVNHVSYTNNVSHSRCTPFTFIQ
jgi:hypothetical protein